MTACVMEITREIADEVVWPKCGTCSVGSYLGLLRVSSSNILPLSCVVNSSVMLLLYMNMLGTHVL